MKNLITGEEKESPLGNVPATMSQINFDKQDIGKYEYRIVYKDHCDTQYNSTYNTLYVLTYLNFNQSTPIVCDDEAQVCTQYYDVEVPLNFATPEMLCKAFTINQIDFSYFKCSVDNTTKQLVVNFQPANDSVQMKF